MTLKHCRTGEIFPAQIDFVSPEEYRFIKQGGRFPNFDWDREKHLEVYKIWLKDLMLGLMSLVDYRKEQWIKINLLESSKENVGKGKEYDHVGGCLIAFACRESFKRGYGGCIGLLPKTELMGHYIKKYGFTVSGVHLSMEGKDARLLIEKYIG